MYSLSLIFKLWDKPHYRSKSFQVDLLNNLSNVAIPGTGIPLSYFCHLKFTAYLLVFIINPIVCLFGAIHKANKLSLVTYDEYVITICKFFKMHLLRPDDWFSFWQLNCRLTSFHSHVTKARGFDLEDKWTFLLEGEELGRKKHTHTHTHIY